MNKNREIIEQNVTTKMFEERTGVNSEVAEEEWECRGVLSWTLGHVVAHGYLHTDVMSATKFKDSICRK
jgi:hypothetical protein